MTVVGDIAQATGPWAPASWDEVTTHLSPRRPPRLVELTVSYRTPAEVVAMAARVLQVAAPDITPPRPVRRSGIEPAVVAAPVGGLAARAAEVAAAELAAVATRSHGGAGPGAVAARAQPGPGRPGTRPGRSAGPRGRRSVGPPGPAPGG